MFLLSDYVLVVFQQLRGFFFGRCLAKLAASGCVGSVRGILEVLPRLLPRLVPLLGSVVQEWGHHTLAIVLRGGRVLILEN